MMDRMSDPTSGGGQNPRPADLHTATGAPPTYRPRYEPPPATVDLRNVLRAVFRRWWLVLPLIAATSFAGYQASGALPTTHKASATLMVGQTTTSPSTLKDDLVASEELAFTYSDLATREPVLSAIVATLKLDMSWSELGDMVQVKRVPDTPLIDVQVEADTAELALKIAQEMTSRIVTLSPTASANRAQDFLEQRAEDIRSEIAQTQGLLERNRRNRDEANSAAVRDAYERRVHANESRLQDLDATYSEVLDDLRAARSLNAVTVFQEPLAARSPKEPNRMMNGLLAAGVGMLIARAIAMVLEARERHSLVRARFKA